MQNREMQKNVASGREEMKEMTEKTSERIHESVAGKMPEGMSEKVEDKMPERMSEKVGDKIPEKIHESTAGKMPEEISEKALGKIPEEKGHEKVSEKLAGKTGKWADKPAMEVRDLHFSYEKNKVLKGVSLKIEEGKVTTIMGANGCGKSTLFFLMTKNLYARKGSIFLKGKNIQNLNLKEFAKKVAIVQQYNSASPDITVENLVAFGRTPHKKMMQGNSEEDDRMVRWALDVTDLSKYRDREVSRLSGGQRQRVWIAMALCQGTKTLFLDEPTTYLDIRYQIEILQLIRKLNREFGMTIIMVLHDINQAIAYSDHVIGMKDGVVLVEGSPKEVVTEENIRRLYGIRLGVTQVDGQTFVLAV